MTFVFAEALGVSLARGLAKAAPRAETPGNSLGLWFGMPGNCLGLLFDESERLVPTRKMPCLVRENPQFDILRLAEILSLPPVAVNRGLVCDLHE